MARTLQKLIHYHGSSRTNLHEAWTAMTENTQRDAVLMLGEIAVIHGTGDTDSFLAMRNTSNDLVYFISSGAVYSSITGLTNTYDTQISDLQDNLSGLSASTKEIQSNVAGLTNSAKTAVQAIAANGSTGSVEGNYISATTAETKSGDFEKEITVGVKIDVNSDLSTATADTKQLADAHAVKTYVDTVSGNIETYLGELENNIADDIEDAIESAQTYTDSQISGITSGIIEDIKNSLSDVYTYKGSVATIADLPDAETYSGKSGDVYNVVAAKGNPGDSDYIPAGTNFAYVPDPKGWDPLGGVVDLSAYATSSQTYNAIEEYGGSVLSSAKTYTDDSISALNIGDYVTSANVETAIATAKQEAIDAASGYTDGKIETLSGNVVANHYTKDDVDNLLDDITNNADGKLNEISGYSKNEYIELTNVSPENTAGEGETADMLQKFMVEAQVEKLSDVSASGKLADAKDVKDYVNSAKNAGVTSAYTAASGLVHDEVVRATGAEDDLQLSINELKSATTVVSAVTAVEFNALTADATNVVGGHSGSAQYVHESGVAAKVENNTLILDFDNLVIDCGSFDS